MGREGSICLYPGNELCLVALSAGGEDPVTLRDLNLKTAKFVEDGFVLPRSKQSMPWLDKDTLLVSRDWGPNTMIQPGYAFVLKLWRRGQPLDRAKEFYSGSASDERGTRATTFHDGEGHQATIVQRGVTFFEAEVSLLRMVGSSSIE
jgi:prolyl oligopeptidase